MQCYLLWNKDHSSNLGTIWGQNHCFHIISQCIQAVKPHWYGVGPLLTLVYWSSSWSDVLPNIDRFNVFDIAAIYYDIVEQQPWKGGNVERETYTHTFTFQHIKTPTHTLMHASVYNSAHMHTHTLSISIHRHSLYLCMLYAYAGCSLRGIAWSFIISSRLSKQTMDRLLKIDDYIEVHMSKKAFI